LLKGSDFLLLDEPFSGLDVCMLDKVVDLLLQVSLSDELKTLIIVSHDIATALAISDTVFILGEEPGVPRYFKKRNRPDRKGSGLAKRCQNA
jgi:polar amino acid transport system ATP-binding protein/sulfate transport system ATP-binding protein/NitT/TauT family transport system ATP-binding protein